MNHGTARMSRRDFLQASTTAAAGILLAACAPQVEVETTSNEAAESP